MARFDFIVANLTCPDGAVSPADNTTGMTTTLRDEPDLAHLGIGDRLPVDLARARAADYLVLREPALGEPIHLLHTWECPTHGTLRLWARVTVVDERIAAVEPIDLLEGLRSVHFVVDDARDVAADWAERRAPIGMSDDEVLAILRARAAASR